MEPVREELKSGEGGRKSYFSVLNVIFLGKKKKQKTKTRGKSEENSRDSFLIHSIFYPSVCTVSPSSE